MICVKCGASMEEGAYFCPICGQIVEPVLETKMNDGQDLEDAPKGINKKKILIGILTVVLIGIMIAEALLLKGPIKRMYTDKELLAVESCLDTLCKAVNTGDYEKYDTVYGFSDYMADMGEEKANFKAGLKAAIETENYYIKNLSYKNLKILSVDDSILLVQAEFDYRKNGDDCTMPTTFRMKKVGDTYQMENWMVFNRQFIDEDAVNDLMSSFNTAVIGQDPEAYLYYCGIDVVASDNAGLPLAMQQIEAISYFYITSQTITSISNVEAYLLYGNYLIVAVVDAKCEMISRLGADAKCQMNRQINKTFLIDVNYKFAEIPTFFEGQQQYYVDELEEWKNSTLEVLRQYDYYESDASNSNNYIDSEAYKSLFLVQEAYTNPPYFDENQGSFMENIQPDILLGAKTNMEIIEVESLIVNSGESLYYREGVDKYYVVRANFSRGYDGDVSANANMVTMVLGKKDGKIYIIPSKGFRGFIMP